MSQQTRKTNIIKRNYNEMINNSINSSSNNESFIKNQQFKSALKFGGPINQDLIIHHNNNVRKSMYYKLPQATTIFDIDSFEKEEKQKIETNINEIDKKNEIDSIKNISSDIPENKQFNSEATNNIINRTINRNENKKMNLFNYFSGQKDNNKNIFDFYNTEKKVMNYGNFLFNDKKDELSNNNNNNNILEKNSINTKINDTNNNIKFNPFLAPQNIEQKNPFISSDNISLNDNNKKENENNNKKEIVENPFLAILKNKKKNPFSNINQLMANIFNNNNNNNNNTVINPFNPNNDNIINPFSSSKKNPFSTIPSNNNINNKNEIKNPFQDINNNHYNPFISNINNPNTNINPFNPFSNNNNNNNKVINPFISSVNNNNTHNCANPFINQTLNNNNIENINDDDEKINVEEEIKIEKDEKKLKDFKEVKYEIINKFYEIKIENLQYLEKENDKSKFISVGEGMLSFQEEKNNNGKKIGIFVLRDLFTKNIKIQGIIIDSSSIEKAKLKNGLDFIMIKNVLATYYKYDKDDIKQETKLTFIRIRVEQINFENLFNKAKEYFEIMKK